MILRSVVACLTAVAVTSLVTFAFALRFGALTVHSAMVGLCTGVAAGVFGFIQTRPVREPRLTRWEITWFVFFAIFAFHAFWWLIYYDHDLLRIGASNNGDICRHIQLARLFAGGEPLWPEHPLHAWETLRYYPGADFLQAILHLLGAEEFQALRWTGMVGSFFLAVALRRWGGPFAVAGFLFAGGLGGFEWLWTGVWKDHQMAMAWKPLPTAIFLAQPGYLYALPTGLILLAEWRRRFFSFGANLDSPRISNSEQRQESKKEIATTPFMPLWVEATLLLGMAWFQLYAFLFLVALLGFWWLIYFARPALRLRVGVLLLLVLPPAAALITLMTNFGGPTAVRWQPGWMQASSGKSAIAFWILNFGLFLPLAAWLWFRLTWRRMRSSVGNVDRREAAEAFVIPAGIAFLACALVAFAPWEWDNTKLMIWSYLLVLPFVWELLLAPRSTTVRTVACILLFFSGAVSLAASSLGNGPDLIIGRRSVIDGLGVALQSVPQRTRFACAPLYYHPLMLNGQRIAMGFEGQLFGFGLPIAELKNELDTLMLGRPGWKQAAARLGVTQVYWGKYEDVVFPNSTQPWATPDALVASGSWGCIYRTPAAQ